MLRTIALIAWLTPTALLASPQEEPHAPTDLENEICFFSNGVLRTFDCPHCLAAYKRKYENKLSKREVKQGWQLLFNGKDLAGFQAPTRDGKWSVKDGVLIGSGGPGVVGTKANFGDFEFVADIRVHDTGKRRGNSGVFIRSSSLTALRGRWPDGLEVQVDHGDPNFWTGAIWKTAKAKKVKTKDKEWFQMRIQARGSDIRVWVGDKLVTEHKAEKPGVRGPISFQVHHPTDVVEFKNVKVRPLDGKAKPKATVKATATAKPKATAK